MKFFFRKRHFFVGDNTRKTTISMPTKAWIALQNISDASGNSIPEVICEGLDQWLTALAEQGEIEFPKDQDGKN